MSKAIEVEIQNRIAAFVQELDILVRKSTLDALHGILANGAPSARRGRPAGSRRGPGRPRGSGRGSADLEGAAEKVVAHVRANDGQGIAAIASATGLDLKVAKKAAASLVASGALKRSGQKRGTVYHVGSGRPARGKAGKRGKKRRARKAKAA